jgi:hypothetical protein
MDWIKGILPKNARLIFCSGAIVLLVTTGCNKAKKFEDLHLLTEKNWQLTSRTQGGADITKECDLDDELLFEDATMFNYDFGNLSCPDNDLTKEAKTWKIMDDYTVLRMKYKFSGQGIASLVEYWKITELSDTLLILEDASAEENDQIPEIRTYHY